MNVRLLDGDSPPLVHEALAAHARRTPDALALDDGARSLSYAQLGAAAATLASALRNRGIGPGAFVPLVADRCSEAIVAIFGILGAGAAYVPLVPGLPPVRIRHVLDQTGAAIVVTTRRHAEQVAGCASGVPIVTIDDLAPEQPALGESIAGPDDPAYVMYTSGSTGVPKGVVVRHRNIAWYTARILELLGPSDAQRAFATTATVAADLGNTAIFPALASGACLRVIDYEAALDGRIFSERFDRRTIDVLKTTPSNLRALLATATEPRAVLPREMLLCGGEALGWETIRRIRSTGATCAIVNHYGPTETTVGALVHRIIEEDAHQREATVPIGSPLPGARAYVLHEDGRRAVAGESGELFLAGEGVAAGYLGLPDETRQRFVPDRFAPSDGSGPLAMYRTGDRVRALDDGELLFEGRIDDQVKVRGYRVEPAEVAAALRGVAGVHEAAIVPRTIDRNGEKEIVLDAYVTPATVDRGVLSAAASERLPDYLMPRSFTALERFPLTPNGKVDRAALPEPAQQSAEATAQPELIDETEILIAEIWHELLGREIDSVDDDFFDLGGHSLLATVAVARIRRAFGVTLGLRAFFDRPTIAGVAAVVNELRQPDARALLAEPRQ